MKQRVMSITGAAVLAVMSSMAGASDSVGAFTGTLNPGIATGATIHGRLVGTAESPVWQRANATSDINLPDIDVDSMTSDHTVAIVGIPNSGSGAGMHAVTGLQTANVYFGDSYTIGAGVSIDMASSPGVLVGISRYSANTTVGGTNVTISTPIYDSANVRIGTAVVPMHLTTQEISGQAGASSAFARSCARNSIGVIQGLMIPHADGQLAGSAAHAASSRTHMDASGLRSFNEWLSLIQARVATNTASSVTTANVTNSCARPTAAVTTVYGYDALLSVRSDEDLQLTFSKEITASTSFRIPLSVQITHV